MNVFLDTNILYEDYFFDNKSNNKILEYCKQGLINIYMSNIVVLELRRQFEKEIDAKNNEIKKILKESSRLRISQQYNEIPKEGQLNIFDAFYKDLSYIDHFHILNYKNEYLPDIVNRAVYRIKPFTEEKIELKDALIWKTYADYAETNTVNDCILLTNNTSDFCKGKEKDTIHPDLQRDTNRFSVINNAFSFIKAKGSTLESPEYQISNYVSQLNINQEFVLEIINNNFIKQIQAAVEMKTNNLHPMDVFKKQYIMDGQVIGYDVDVSECEDIEHEVLSNTALISGALYANCEAELFEYNASRDHGEEAYTPVYEIYITYIINFNFNLSLNEEVSDFEITDINIYTVD